MAVHISDHETRDPTDSEQEHDLTTSPVIVHTHHLRWRCVVDVVHKASASELLRVGEALDVGIDAHDDRLQHGELLEGTVCALGEAVLHHKALAAVAAFVALSLQMQ
jgi:hypothetical protein